ncbi:MAG: tetratricopeptide repeat protein, partial [Planctomycetes bacterium]|nr:tetratricopeptide repeat protein [Planctomycetota bacterium]
DEAIAHYREALPVLREVGDNFNAAWCLQGEALAIGKSDPARAATLLDEAARAFRDSGSPAGLASVLHIASQIRFRLGDFPAARRLALEAVEEFRRVGEKPSLTVALNTLGASLRATGDLDGAAKAHRESIATSLDPRVSAASHEELSVTLEDAGDLAGAIRECEASTSLTERRGDPKHLAGSLGRLSSLMALTGAHAAAEALLRTRASLLGLPENDTASLHHACLRLCAGDPRETARILEALGPPAPETRTVDMASYNFFVADTLSDLGRTAECLRTARAAFGDGTSLTRLHAFGALLVIAQAELEEGHVPEAVARAREAVGIGAELGAPPRESEARALLARALSCAGQGAEAEVESAKAVALAGPLARADVVALARAAAVASADATVVDSRVRELEEALARPGICARSAARISLDAVDALRHAGRVATATALARRAAQRALEAGAPFWRDRLMATARGDRGAVSDTI